LNNIRIGKISENDKKILDSRIKKFDPHSFIKPTILTTHNQKVENVNHQFLKQIPDKEFIFDAKYQGEDSKIEFLKKNCLAYQRLVLKVGAQVMMIKNTLSKEGIINGSIGVIRDFSIKKNYPIVEFANSKTFTIVPEEWQVEKFDHDLGTTKIEASLSQIPLILAWAITIHKSQGLTLDKISCDLSNCFSPGQAYVALSRAKNIEGIFIESLNYSKIYANQEAVEFYNKIISHD
jgi:ATP-dependent exoDNAse (exonuclease V) alpha subunit